MSRIQCHNGESFDGAKSKFSAENASMVNGGFLCNGRFASGEFRERDGTFEIGSSAYRSSEWVLFIVCVRWVVFDV